MTSIRLIATDDRCVINGHPRPGIPTLIGTQGIIDAPSDWLRNLALDRRSPATTLGEYAKALREFYARLGADRQRWDRVSDAYLQRWRDDMAVAGLRKATINAKISTVFRFYVWAEQTQRVRDLVQLSERGARPISSKRSVSKFGVRYASPLLFKTTAQPTRHTPTGDEIDALHEELEGPHACRDGLICSWAEELGLRRSEILSLRVDQIPERDEILRLQNEGRTHPIYIVGKGGNEAVVGAHPELLAHTRDYIEFERDAAWREAKDRTPKLRPSPHVFLSSRGAVLTPNAVSKRMGVLFRRAGIQKAALHRLRAVFITRLVEQLIDQVDEHGRHLSTDTMVLIIMEAGRWRSPTTIRYYINEARARRAFARRHETSVTQ